ncbi:MAG TPA: hypothetical protein DCQ98_16665 [Planctomycetaceae bacterium]|nr:hypothetical protein [Planctomycetaceae bacterium]HRF02924.1 NUDIX hydrolase [Pirellulaceae bacterium]
MSDYLDRLPEAMRDRGNSEAGEIEILDREPGDPTTGIVFENRWFMVVTDPVRFPDGRTGTYSRVIESAALGGHNGTVVVPLTEDAVGFVRIFRHATRSWEWELPRGFREPGLDGEANARNELLEETGLEAGSVRLVGRVNPNTGLFAGSIEVFVAQIARGEVHRAEASRSEAIREVRFVPLEELDEFLLDEVTCGLSLNAIFFAKLQGLLR